MSSFPVSKLLSVINNFFKVYQLLFRNKFCKFAWWASPTRKIVLGKIQRK
ncbi:hypothetical protein HMPREF0670_00607 [Prevotella sp. oral taxon 317 str. F0108]|jgi:hypothetical protein|nr:hypothetical protein HMPREF0670_00607 [Prevotella sp. oral taxon 317 str. F0108]